MKIIEVTGGPMLASCVPVIRTAFSTVLDELGLTEADGPTSPAFITLDGLRSALDSGGRLFAGTESSQPVGAVIVRPATESGVFHLERLAVRPAQRHRGLGRSLLDHAVRVAGEQGGHQVSVSLIDDNGRLKRWYQAQHFTETAARNFPHLPFTVCFMARQLSSEVGCHPSPCRGGPPA